MKYWKIDKYQDQKKNIFLFLVSELDELDAKKTSLRDLRAGIDRLFEHIGKNTSINDLDNITR